MEKSMTRLRSAWLPKDMIMALSKNGLITIPAWVAHFFCVLWADRIGWKLRIFRGQSVGRRCLGFMGML